MGDAASVGVYTVMHDQAQVSQLDRRFSERVRVRRGRVGRGGNLWTRGAHRQNVPKQNSRKCQPSAEPFSDNTAIRSSRTVASASFLPERRSVNNRSASRRLPEATNGRT